MSITSMCIDHKQIFTLSLITILLGMNFLVVMLGVDQRRRLLLLIIRFILVLQDELEVFVFAGQYLRIKLFLFFA